jgi:DDE superfamily endonuclease
MVQILTDEEMLEQGLALVRLRVKRIEGVGDEKSVRRFVAHFGSKPLACAHLWEALQFTDNEDALVVPGGKSVKHFLIALHWLRRYPTETEQEALFGLSDRTCRKWSLYYCQKIAALRDEVVGILSLSCLFCTCNQNSVVSYPSVLVAQIVWPDEWQDDNAPTFLISVDGTHCRIYEPQHPEFSKNPAYYSHKFHQAALNYEIGVSLFTSDVVWVNGPFPAGQPDIKVFRERGLKEKIPPGKRITGDNGYRGEPALISTPNQHDPPELKNFKARAQARHESFNKRVKDFACLSERFRHGIEKHEAAFVAVCVVVQFQMENGSPLFEI